MQDVRKVLNMKRAMFRVDNEKCNGCGRCISVCPGNLTGGNVLKMINGKPVMSDQNNFGWRGCWRCEHCMAVCPQAAISVLGVSPENAPRKPDESVSDELSRLIAYRRACRSYRQEDVDPKVINEILDTLSAMPTGGNSYGIEFSVVDSQNGMRKLYETMFPYQQTSLFSQPDDFHKLGIYNAPHLFIAHKTVGNRFHDGDLTELGIATAYFELLANAYGLGTVICNYAAEQILRNKAARNLLEIADDHTALAAVGFGYPKIPYARGVIKRKRIHHLS